MNDEIREGVRAELKRRGLTHAQMAEQLGMPRPQLTRMLTGQSGQVPEAWRKLFGALDLHLTVAPCNTKEE